MNWHLAPCCATGEPSPAPGSKINDVVMALRLVLEVGRLPRLPQ
jgi:hypothetical protein